MPTNDTSLRLLFAKNFAKFVEDNFLLPISGPGLTDIVSGCGATKTNLPNVWRGPKCKFYGVAFHKDSSVKSGKQTVAVSNDGMIKVYSPKFIQVFWRMKANNGVSSFEHIQFNNFINALMFIDLYFVKNDRESAYRVNTPSKW